MFASLKPWICVAYKIKPFTGRNGVGDKLFGTTVDSYCYPVGDVKLITNAAGAEVKSTTQLYVLGTETIKVTDNVVFEGTEHPIHAISTFYRNGVPDIKVVYI